MTGIAVSPPGNTEETTNSETSDNNDKLPQAPDTGAPEEDFSAGGTRENHFRRNFCGEKSQKIAYLLGNRNREFTLSAYPTFWFYFPDMIERVNQIEFLVTELETGKKIYNRIIQPEIKSGIAGIKLPRKEEYALSPEINYSWSLKVDCLGTDRETEILLEGWLSRLTSNSELQDRLAGVSELEKYRVYLEHDLLYDAVTEVAQRRITQPNNVRVKTAWNQLLTELGWQDLSSQSTVEPHILDTQISSN